MKKFTAIVLSWLLAFPVLALWVLFAPAFCVFALISEKLLRWIDFDCSDSELSWSWLGVEVKFELGES